MESALKHSETMSTHISFRKGAVWVSVVLNTEPYQTLSVQEYDIVSETENSVDALDHIFGDAIVALEGLSAVKQNEDSSLNTK